MIEAKRIGGYRPCDWECGRSASYELSCDTPEGEKRRLFACKTHLIAAFMRVTENEMNGGAIHPGMDAPQ
ncbi:MAG: hypothetical protein U5N86_04640 [Planctomycetota bacterium]|nr:hypothetical protein [Planctomycetota bacterium]